MSASVASWAPRSMLDELMARSEGHRQEAAQLLLHMLWHPWRGRCWMSVRRRALRREAMTMHRMQDAAVTVLARPENIDALAQRLVSSPWK